MKLPYGLIFFILIITPVLAKDKPSKMVEEGRYQEAIKHYDRMIKEHPEWTQPHFGKGVALYKSKNIEEAAKEFEKSIAAKSDLQKSAAYYNLGNILLNSQKPQEALKFYRKALELNPSDIEAKHNYELARRMLQQQQQQQQNNQNQDNQDQNKDQEQKQDQQNKDQQNKENKQQQDQQQNQNEQQKKEEKKQQQQNQPQNQERQDQEKQQQQQPRSQDQEQQQKEMKKQEAAQILNSLKQNQKEMMRKRVKVKTSGAKKEKDW